ncbi:MAG: hypothetical protein J6I46_09620 [Ruminococcus sp.]|nr:hypothetical protein [Ruminococcus sp.]
MKTLKFYGYSDDTFGEFAETNVDYDTCGEDIAVELIVSDGVKRLSVIGRYGSTGTWSIEVFSHDEDHNPDWTMRLYFEDYSPVLEIDCPDNIRVWCTNEDIEEMTEHSEPLPMQWQRSLMMNFLRKE